MKKNTAIEALEARIAPAVLFAVEAGTNQLVSFDSAAPGTLLTDTTITGIAAGDIVAGIDFDPETGTLAALVITDNGATRTASIYSIDPLTAAAVPLFINVGIGVRVQILTRLSGAVSGAGWPEASELKWLVDFTM